MKTTLDIPNDLYREAKVKAAKEGRKIKDLVTEGLILVLQGGSALQNEELAPTAFNAMRDACGCVASGISDLATNPEHLQGLGRE